MRQQTHETNSSDHSLTISTVSCIKILFTITKKNSQLNLHSI